MSTTMEHTREEMSLPELLALEPHELAAWKQQVLERAMYAGSTFRKVGDSEQALDAARVDALYNRQHQQAVEDFGERLADNWRARRRMSVAGEAGAM